MELITQARFGADIIGTVKNNFNWQTRSEWDKYLNPIHFLNIFIRWNYPIILHLPTIPNIISLSI